ncbi:MULTISPECIES: helix-turn-helix domain-containing protein [Pseudanabaena]|uniref:Helix-turn-helix, AraC domain protein n=2 Tax=Pseudanabaena TaxID=1152 RepID=L8N473_9CYAN|nr:MULTISPECIES: helix-turn-helix domain-containing protein [Pseudanabaena]ELS33889.1 Helix-turn-helix, AraC domain protein [Pseudanabaena biceps PCC 7429]MDG3493915.1 hypothetical protein [Pseudanabaena catenata USMAC16]
MNKKGTDLNPIGFNKQSMEMMMSSLVTSPFDVYESPSNNIMLTEFKKFSQKIIKHKAYVPFFEVFDVRPSQCEYTHFIGDKWIKKNSDSSGFSFYASEIEYGLKVNSGSFVDGNLLGINPAFFNKILNGYQSNGLFPDFLKDIQDPCIQKYIQDIVFDIKNSAYTQNYLSVDYTGLRIEENIAYLLRLIAGKHLSTKCNFGARQVKEIIEYFDDKVITNQPITIEELIEKFPVEESLYWLDAFKNDLKKTPYQYYIDRKNVFLSGLVEENQRMLISDQKKLFNLIHELVENPDSSLAFEFQMGNETLLQFLSRKLDYDRYKHENSFKNHCEKMGIACLRYYLFLCIEKAKHLLITTEKSIGEISCICGFDDDKSFRKSFRNRANNLKPEKFREDYKKTSLRFDLKVGD